MNDETITLTKGDLKKLVFYASYGVRTAKTGSFKTTIENIIFRYATILKMESRIRNSKFGELTK